MWVALSNCGVFCHVTAEGGHDEVVDAPTSKVTACAFGGTDLDHLFITTSRGNLEPDSDPLAGALFRAEVGVRGLPVHEFAG